jgi:hypothetical protein
VRQEVFFIVVGFKILRNEIFRVILFAFYDCSKIIFNFIFIYIYLDNQSINQFFILTCCSTAAGANYRVSTIIKVQKYAMCPTNISAILLLLSSSSSLFLVTGFLSSLVLLPLSQW